MPSAHDNETAASLVVLRSAKELVDHQIKFIYPFSPRMTEK